ncbi:soluble scavenger receptor cysteine-rich domain-containing protein SSC5D-like [Penaeus indicus]|uniref:soluble scavenger receptor cysteine-rich domain-containing protein SSC5D-like n=1 Tax=Penaeus indicus TaxID=29960 RepID=UPI00300C0AFD
MSTPTPTSMPTPTPTPRPTSMPTPTPTPTPTPHPHPRPCPCPRPHPRPSQDLKSPGKRKPLQRRSDKQFTITGLSISPDHHSHHTTVHCLITALKISPTIAVITQSSPHNNSLPHHSSQYHSHHTITTQQFTTSPQLSVSPRTTAVLTQSSHSNSPPHHISQYLTEPPQSSHNHHTTVHHHTTALNIPRDHRSHHTITTQQFTSTPQLPISLRTTAVITRPPHNRRSKIYRRTDKGTPITIITITMNTLK